MKKKLKFSIFIKLFFSLFTILMLLSVNSFAAPPDDGKLRVIVFGAHPDDCEIKAGGVAAIWAAKGCHVKFVAVANGDIGHWKMAGGPLALRRKAEVEKAASILGIDTVVLDNHDGEIMPTMENRKIVTRLIREWKADIVMSHRSNDYHPDHRYCSILVQDAGYMVTVPFFCPDTPSLKKNPIFMYLSDNFQKPNPLEPDVVISIDSVIEKKLEALSAMESQFLEGGVEGSEDKMPKNKQEYDKGQEKVKENFRARFRNTADKYREQLIKVYGPEQGKAVKYAEAFEVCEYGSQPSAEELKKLFPFGE